MTVKIFEVNKPGQSLVDRARKFVCRDGQSSFDIA